MFAAETATADLLLDCSLSTAWKEQNAWRILETHFGLGLQFLNTWQLWKQDAQRPRMLHYVALTAAAPTTDDLRRTTANSPQLRALVAQLEAHWFGLQPGFHRITLEGGQLLLTLCVGSLTALLRQQHFLADTIYFHAATSAPAATTDWDLWAIKALTKSCRRGTQLVSKSMAPDTTASLKQCGFELELAAYPSLHNAGSYTPILCGPFNPRWTIKTTRQPQSPKATLPGRCAVIGAGLAGASVAAALARRGWQVQVLDQATAPAAGASGLPVGLVVPHVSADDCSLSRLSRSGVRLIRQQMSQLLRRGQDWDATGTLECRLGDASELPVKLSAAAAEWSRPADPGTLAKAGCQTDLPAIWHAVAAWLKPAQLVRAWLAQDGVEFLGGMQVADLQFRNREWELLAADGCLLARADRVVLANAAGAQALLEQLRKRPSPLDIAPLLGMQSVLGQLSWDLHQGDQQAAFPAFPVNGAGSVIPGIPTAAGKAWFIGSSYGAQHKPRASEQENHASNFERLQQLLPHLASTLSAQFESGALQAWSSTRCVTADRLPLLGPLLDADDDGLWICAGMGSRGLTLSSLCAELLAAQWSAEPLPIEWSLATRLLASRGPSCTAAPTCKSEIKSG